MRPVLPALAALALLAACGADQGDADHGGGRGTSQEQNDLTIDVDTGDGSGRQTWTLVCDGAATGTHPDPEAACSHLEDLDDPFAPIPADVACTEQYGGPQTAHVTGRWGGDPVDVELARVNGCRISQWDALVPVVPTAG